MFQSPKLTDAGKNLYYRNMDGDGIVFTTIQMGKGTISTPISTMAALVDPVVIIPAEVRNNNGQYADISGKFSNADLSEGFYWREIGVFAADPDYPEDRSKDILYCYQNAHDTADFIPVAAVETVEKNITIPVIVGDASTVSCTLDKSLIYITEQDLLDTIEKHNTSNESHEDIRKLALNSVQKGDVYTKPESDRLLEDAVAAHNTTPDAHPQILAALAALDSRITVLELKYGTDVTGNSFEVSFQNLDGVDVTGVWNEPYARIEF